MSTLNRAATRFARDMIAGFQNVRRPIARAMYCYGPLSVLFIVALGVFIGADWVGIGDALFGETGAWLGSGIGVFVAGVFISRALDEL